jgi:hypothetical protein
MQILTTAAKCVRDSLIIMREIVVYTAIFSAPLVVLASDGLSPIGRQILGLHLVFMLALWLTIHRGRKALERSGIQPSGVDNLCTGFAAGASLIYALSFWPIAYLAMWLGLGLSICPFTLFTSSLNPYSVSITLVLIPFLCLAMVVCLSPMILPVITVRLAWKVRHRMLLPSNLLPTGVALAFILISMVNLPLTGADVAQRLTTSQDKRLALLAKEILKPLEEDRFWGLPMPSLGAQWLLGKPCPSTHDPSTGWGSMLSRYVD